MPTVFTSSCATASAWSGAALLALCGALPSQAQAIAAPQACASIALAPTVVRNPAFERVLAADDRRYAAMSAGSVDALADMLADELLYTHSSAITDTKPDYLASLRKGNIVYHGAHRDGVLMRQRGDLVVMAGHVTIEATIDGTRKVLDNRFTATWVNDAGQWKLLSWASTAIPRI